MEVSKALERLTRNTAVYCVPPSCPILPSSPSALVFMRDYVALNTPVVIQNAFNHWPALENWTDEYLSERLGDRQISVEVTPSMRILLARFLSFHCIFLILTRFDRRARRCRLRNRRGHHVYNAGNAAHDIPRIFAAVER